MSNETVEIHVDPLCPWCWLTAQWLFEVEQVRPITVTTKVLSLAELNRGDEPLHPALEAGSRAVRLLVAARRRGGETAIRALYVALAGAQHDRDQPLTEMDTLRAAAAETGLPGTFVDDVLVDPRTHDEVLVEYASAHDRGAFGVPTLSVEGSAPYFGPVIDRRITGEDACALWDVVRPLLLQPFVFELKRPRTDKPQVGRELRQAELAAS